jgi:hypothetical protein
MSHPAFVDCSPAFCYTFMGPELYFLDLVWHGLRVIGKTNGRGGGGGRPKYLDVVEECSGSETCMALFLGPAWQGFEGISRTRERKDWASAMTCDACNAAAELRAGSAKKSECGGWGCPLTSSFMVFHFVFKRLHGTLIV